MLQPAWGAAAHTLLLERRGEHDGHGLHSGLGLQHKIAAEQWARELPGRSTAHLEDYLRVQVPDIPLPTRRQLQNFRNHALAKVGQTAKLPATMTVTPVQHELQKWTGQASADSLAVVQWAVLSETEWLHTLYNARLF